MHDLSNLERREGFTSPQRRMAFVVLLFCSFFALNVVQTQDRAYALGLDVPFRSLVPTSVAGAGVTAGAGEVAAVGATAAEVATGGAVVAAAAPVAVVAGAVLLTGAAVYLGWRWAGGGSSTTAYDPPGTGVVTYTHPAGYTANVGSFGTCPVQFQPTSNLCVQLILTGPASPTVAGTLYSTDSGGTKRGHSLGAYAAPSTRWIQTSVTALNGVTPDAYCISSSQGTLPPVMTNGNLAGYGVSGQCITAPKAPVSQSTAATGQTTVTTRPTSQCSGGGSVVGAAVTYTGGTAAGSLPPFVAPACPTGQTRTGLTTPTTFPDGSTAPSPLAAWTAPTVPSGFPDCNTTTKVCQLNLFRLGHAAGEQTCDVSGNCEDWQNQTQRLGVPVTVKTLVAVTIGGVAYAAGDSITEQPRTFRNGDTLSCKWGPYAIPVDECKVVPTEPPTVQGTGALDPSNRRCYPIGWAQLNPLEWVVKPLKCLFIPTDAAVQAAGASISEAWAGTAPATISSKVGEVAAPIVALKDDAGPTDCQGPSFVIPQLPAMHSTLTLHPLSTCNELTTYLLGIYMPIATALIYIGGFFAGTRVILKSFNLDTPEEV